MLKNFGVIRWLGLRGGFIGAFIGLLPGLGGAMADWMAYGSAVAQFKERFGNGNIKGVIGSEGAQQCTKGNKYDTHSIIWNHRCTVCRSFNEFVYVSKF